MRFSTLVKSIRKEEHTQQLITAYKQKNREISIGLYNKLKSQRKCYNFQKKFKHALEIHHKDGDRTNQEEKNLGTCCHKCHEILDTEIQKQKNENKQNDTEN
jgi:hypothetical protein